MTTTSPTCSEADTTLRIAGWSRDADGRVQVHVSLYRQGERVGFLFVRSGRTPEAALWRASVAIGLGRLPQTLFTYNYLAETKN